MTARSDRSLWCRILALVLVCCILINCAPVRAEAVAAEISLLGMGLAACVILYTFGVVFNPTSQAQIEALGQSYSDHLLASATTEEEIIIVNTVMLQIANEMINGSSSGSGDGSDDGDDDYVLKFSDFGSFIAGLTISWASKFFDGKSVEVVDPDAVPTGSLIAAGTPVYVNGGSLSCTADVDVCIVKARYTSTSGDCLVTIGYTSKSGWTYCYSSSNTANNCYGPVEIDGVDYYYWSWNEFISSSSLSAGSFYLGSGYKYGASAASVDALNLAITGTYGELSSYSEDVSPDLITGGIKTAVDDGYNVEDITLPDLEYGNIMTEGQTVQDAVTQTATQLVDGTMTWDQYIDLITNGNGINITINNGGGTSDDYPIDSGGVSSTPLTPSQLTPYVVDLRDFFPFCIPFDLYDFFSILAADPVAPVFRWELQDLAGNVYPIEIDLSPWDSYAAVFRSLQLLVFVIGLAMASRKFIKW